MALPEELAQWLEDERISTKSKQLLNLFENSFVVFQTNLLLSFFENYE